ncbi:MAG: hypothetical protein ACRDN0_21975 [Trebonia sp.]
MNAGREPVSHSSGGGSVAKPPIPPDSPSPPSPPGPSRQSGGRDPLLSLRSAVILGGSALISACAGVLAYLVAASVPAAFLAAGPAFAGSVALLNAIIS